MEKDGEKNGEDGEVEEDVHKRILREIEGFLEEMPLWVHNA